ncbi:MAG: hypothetical protein DRN20_06920 [Thermoplasmata archaeon]|nr:MAG: hypothetical protein DRN20_06920 [Thermoplasmata archaeon]
MTRKFYYLIRKVPSTGTYHLYIRAKPRFSVREIFSKQDRLIMSLPDLPFNQKEFQLKIGSLRETEEVFFKLEPIGIDVYRYSYGYINKVKKEIYVCYDMVMELVFYDKEKINILLEYLKKEWGGEWIEDEV